MAIKWQDIVKYGGTGLVGLGIFLGLLFSLAGVSHSDDGDKECTDCYSEIKIFSTYWEIRVTFERPDENVVFKKRTRSRTLWINLHKIEELVTTNPEIKVDILVPTNRIAFTEINHLEYGRLRFLKEGDTLIKRNTKSRPSPSRIILHGQKGALQTVKWNFDLEHFLMEDINIDPVWLPTGFRPLIKCDSLIRIEYDICDRTIQITLMRCFSYYIKSIPITFPSDFFTIKYFTSYLKSNYSAIFFIRNLMGVACISRVRKTYLCF